MIIRSQDKTMIVNLKNIANIHIAGKQIRVVYSQGECADDIAEYFTKEKTIKVLDIIQDKYLSRMELDGGYDIVSDCYVQPNYWVLPKVFQMPQDSEVQYERI